nr:MAG TPA: hypothetical protein [Caudoviricetes sp.]
MTFLYLWVVKKFQKRKILAKNNHTMAHNNYDGMADVIVERWNP